jgi:kynureninase
MTAPVIGRGEARALDEEDELAAFRGRFVIDEAAPLYFDGNSLGRLPRSTPARLLQVVEEEWGRGLVGSWSFWMDRPRVVGDFLAEHLLGAGAGEVVVGDSTTVNFYKLVVAALEARPDRRVIVTDETNFPSDRYVLQGLAEQRGLELRLTTGDPGPAEIAAAVAGGDVALVTLSHVSFHSGAMLDLPAITAAAHAGRALILWDLSHAVGAVPVRLEEDGVDLAVGCAYKYLNGGPGAPAFTYVRRGLQEQLRQPIWGWFGAADQFAMGPNYRPAPGIDRFSVGTPPIVGLASVEEGAAMVAEAGVDRVRRKSLDLTDLAIGLFDEWLAPLGAELVTPRAIERRGSHLSFRHPDAWPICRALIENHRVVPDFREPDVLRFGFAPLYTRFVDAWDAIDRLREVLARREYEAFSSERSRVT